jgi:large conductance mechanosensitive channel
MSIIKEFKEFAMRGNVVDLAVWVVIGAAFGKIVTSLVTDVIMPLIGVLTGGLNFTDYKLILRPGVLATEGVAAIPALTLNYGTFLQVVVDFLIVAFCIFMVIKAMNKIKKKEEEPAEKWPTQEALLTEIRDLLKK